MKNKIDFHAHVLPGADHGCLNVETSKIQLEYASKADVDIVVATSHFYPHMHTIKGFSKKRKECFEQVRFLLNSDMPKLLCAAEVLLYPGMDKIDGLSELCVCGTNVILIELPYCRSFDDKLVETLVNIRDKCALNVILAHAERYDYISMSEIIKLGFQVQLNAASICSIRKNKLCMKYINDGCVSAIGTDIHGTVNEYKKYNKALRKLGNNADVILDKSRKLLGL